MSIVQVAWLAEIEKLIQQELDHQYESGKRDGQQESEDFKRGELIGHQKGYHDGAEAERAESEGVVVEIAKRTETHGDCTLPHWTYTFRSSQRFVVGSSVHLTRIEDN